jgi:hypothetical protein
VPRFVFIKCLGSPTRWDGERYFTYLDRVRAGLPLDLQELTAPDRYNLRGDRSLWHARVSGLQLAKESLVLNLVGDSERRRFTLTYNGVRKVSSTVCSTACMPSITVQELVLLRQSVYRHALAFLPGTMMVVYSESVSFSEEHVH